MLVLDLDGARAGLFERPHRVGDIDRVAEASVRVDNQRQIDDAANRQDVVRDLTQIDEFEVGKSEVHVGEACAGEINRLKPEIGDHPRGERIRAPGKMTPRSRASIPRKVSMSARATQCLLGPGPRP